MCDKGVRALADKRLSKGLLGPPTVPLINELMFTLLSMSFIIKTSTAH